MTLVDWLRCAPLLLLVLGCGSSKSRVGSPGNPAAELAGASCAPEGDGFTVGIYGWDPGSRAKVATTAVDGVVVVRYERHGCDVLLEVLGRCISRKSHYAYQSAPESRRISATNRLEIGARFAVAQSRLHAELEQIQALGADSLRHGIEAVASGTTIGPKDLEGDCAGATHVVTAIHRGAFLLGAGTAQVVQANVPLFDMQRRQQLRVIDEAGSPVLCSQQRPDLIPGCDVPMALTLTPIGQSYGVTSGPPRACPADMIAIDEGTLDMGCHNGNPNERPVHQVAVPAFCMDRDEVTAGEYQDCVKAGACPVLSGTCQGWRPLSPEHPQACVTPESAERFCQTRARRLPTEAEWEFAARGGADGWPFPIGITEPGPGEACIGQNSPCKVRSYRPESFMLHDLSGNVREWTSGFFVEYALHARRDPHGALSGTQVVARGGYYRSGRDDARSITRHVVVPRGYPEIGFRCASSR